MTKLELKELAKRWRQVTRVDGRIDIHLLKTDKGLFVASAHSEVVGRIVDVDAAPTDRPA